MSLTKEDRGSHLYPSNLDYLKEHYGLILNEDLYFISYEYEGENLMPNIYVYRKGEDV